MMARSLGVAQRYWINDAFESLVDFWTQASQKRSNLELRLHLLKILKRTQGNPEIARQIFQAARDRWGEYNRHWRAVRFFYLNRCSFSGTTAAGGFSANSSQNRFTLSSIQRIEPLTDVLEHVRISNLDYYALFENLEEGDFLFLDPPYSEAKKLYGDKGELHEFDYELFAARLQKVPCRWLCTLDDTTYIRKIFNWAHITPWTLQYGMNNYRQEFCEKGKELFISNYELPALQPARD